MVNLSFSFCPFVLRENVQVKRLQHVRSDPPNLDLDPTSCLDSLYRELLPTTLYLLAPGHAQSARMLRSFSSTLPHELRLLSALQPSRRPLSIRLSYPRLHEGHQQHLSLSGHLSLQPYRSSRAFHLTPRRDIPIPAVLALLKVRLEAR